MRAGIIALIVAGVLCGQNGRYYPPVDPPSAPIYGADYCGSTNGSSSGFQCTWALGTTPPAGTSVVGVAPMNGVAAALTGVYDGTGVNGQTGSSTYTILGPYDNGANFRSYIFYALNVSPTSSKLTFVWTGSTAWIYPRAIKVFGATAYDGYAQKQSTGAGTAWTTSPNTITTTGKNDLLIGFGTNSCGGGSPSAGADGQGHSFTLQGHNNGVSVVEYLQETSLGTYSAAMTGVSCRWNMEVVAFK